MSTRTGAGLVRARNLVLSLDANDSKSFSGEDSTNEWGDDFTKGGTEITSISTYPIDPLTAPVWTRRGTAYNPVRVKNPTKFYTGAHWPRTFWNGDVQNGSTLSAGTKVTVSGYYLPWCSDMDDLIAANRGLTSTGIGLMFYSSAGHGGDVLLISPTMTHPEDGSTMYGYNNWWYFEATWTSPSGGANTLRLEDRGWDYYNNNDGTSGGSEIHEVEYYYMNVQVEYKGYKTPFITNSGGSGGSRSTTDVWKDRSGQSRHFNIANQAGPKKAQRHRVTRRQGGSFWETTTEASKVNSVDLDGTDDYMDLGTDVDFKTTGGWTVATWINYDSVPGSYNNTTAPGNFIGADSINYNSWYWSVLSSKLALWDMGPGSVWKYGNTTITSGRWHHAVLVSDPNNNTYYCYLNGQDDMSSGWSAYNGSWQTSRAGLRIRYIGRGNSGNIRMVNGKIGSTRVWDKPLTAKEIEHLYNSERKKYGL